MKKLALIIAYMVCFLCACVTLYAQNDPPVHLNVKGLETLHPSSISVKFEIDSIAQLDYLKVFDSTRFAAIRLGYDENAVFKEVLDLNDGSYQYLEMILKDFSGRDWNGMFLALNETYPPNAVAIGSYLASAEDLGDGWFKIKIPVTDLGPIGMLSHITFPHAFNTNIGVKNITFSGGAKSFEWFGVEKYDNAIKENQPGQSQLVFNPDGIRPDQLTLKVLSQNVVLTQDMMPYKSFTVGTVAGKNKLLGIVSGKDGAIYYSDTLTFNVPAGLEYHVTNVSCHGGSDGSIDISLEGGLEPYIFAWSNGANTEDVSGLQAGIYTISIADSLGRSLTSNIRVNEPDRLSATLMPSGCEGDSLLLKVSGGVAPYKYSINNGAFENLGNPDSNVAWRLLTNQSIDQDEVYPAVPDYGSDHESNLYVTGRYVDTLRFGDEVVGEAGENGSYLVKLNTYGEFQWGVHNPDIYVVSSVTDEGGNTTLYINVLSSTEVQGHQLGAGLYLLRIDTEGVVTWAESVTMTVADMDTDGQGNIYAMQLSNGQGTYMSKYLNDGQLLWSKKVMSEGAALTDIDVTSNGNVFAIGHFEKTIDLGGLIFTSKGYNDAFVVAYNADGYTLWAKTGTSSEKNVWGNRVVADEDGNVFVTVEYYKPNGKFDDIVIDEAAVVLIRLEALKGDVVWIRPFAFAGFLSFFYNFNMAIQNDGTIFMAVQSIDFLLREGEEVDIRYYTNFLLGFDYSGALTSSVGIGNAYYDHGLEVALVATNDNHVVYPDYRTGYTIIKRGASMSQLIPWNGADQYVTVKSVNDCSVTVESDSIDTSPVAPAICYVTSETEGNRIVLSPDQEEVDFYNIYKETGATDQYEFIGFTTGSEFLDSISNTWERSYKYVVTSVNACDVESKRSEAHRTMHLTVNQGNLGQINLIWDGYEGFEYNSYKIYKGSSLSDMQLITSVPSYLFTYTDLDPSIYAQFYQIRIETEDACTPPLQPAFNGRIAEGNEAFEVTSNISANYGQAGNLSFYPNPGLDRVHVKFSPDGDEYLLKVIDSGGRVVRQIEGVFDKAVIERGELPAGIYNVVLSKNSGNPMNGRIAFH
ncbi:hypothetical protein JMN32_22690 [Fulvivirga sp. 29W222]|uniref:Secretion system C-terminal sorting domain-containing protein n=1 Tax=Fulvivirga marina TaxID=2494733 RepID=A0A937G1V2_9BACT|nr:hypothetical protein [Fulvivirga marina]MBL6449137.1 hypothetical protein [Fulvivirga marina]